MAVLPVLAVASAVVGAAATLEQGAAAKNAADYQAQVARNNATVAEQQAQYAMQAGQAAAENQSRKGAAQIGHIKVAQAASGVDVNSGSALDVQTGQREVNQLDSETVLSNAQLHAYGYRTQATNFQSEGQLDEMKGQQAEEGSYLKAGGDLLSSASGISGKWTGGSSNIGNSIFGGGSPSGYGTGA